MSDSQEDKDKAWVNESLIKAFKDNDLPAFTAALENGADPNLFCDGKCLLAASIKRGQFEETKLLLKAGANIKYPGHELDFLLLQAINRGADAAMLKTLIDAGIDVNQHDQFRDTPLVHSIKRKNETIARALIENGADILIQDSDGYNALDFCAMFGLEKLAFDLMHIHHIRPDQSNGPTSLLVNAASSNCLELCRTLLDQGHDVNQCDNKTGDTPLIRAAARAGSAELVALLLDRGARIDDHDGSRKTALYCAIKNKREDIACLLIDRGADTTLTDPENQPLLEETLRRGLPRVVEKLVDLGHDVTIRDDKGRTYLHKFFTSSAIIATLIKAGADINAQDNDGVTPLMGVLSNSEEVKSRIEHGARMDICDNKGRTALRAAIDIGAPAAAKILFESGARLAEINPHTADTGQAITKLLLDFGVPPEAFNARRLSVPAAEALEQWYKRKRILQGDNPVIRAVKGGSAPEIMDSFVRPGDGRLDIQAMKDMRDGAGSTLLEVLGANGQLGLVFSPRYWKGAEAEADKLRLEIPPAYRVQANTAMIHTTAKIDRLDKLLPRPRRRAP